MPIDKDIPNDKEAYCELVASQEEVYLEETEEELRAILIFEDLSTPERQAPAITDGFCSVGSVEGQVQREVEELITGDSDDPPLSEEQVRKMIEESDTENL